MEPLRSMLVFFLAIATLFCIQISSTAQTVHVVGDTADGWTLRPDGVINSGYQESRFIDWASKHKFIVGDILEFNFPDGIYDVAETTRFNYVNCIPFDPYILIKKSPARITLRRTGEHYFISRLISCPDPPDCRIYRGPDCINGLKLAINVSSGDAPILSPSFGDSSTASLPSAAAPSSLSQERTQHMVPPKMRHRSRINAAAPNPASPHVQWVDSTPPPFTAAVAPAPVFDHNKIDSSDVLKTSPSLFGIIVFLSFIIFSNLN